MYTTYTPLGLHWPIADQPVDARLNWLLSANAAESARLSRSGIDEQLMMMRRPVSVERAYAMFGLLLGTLPPAAIFYRMFGDALARPSFEWGLFLLVLAMNIVCGLAGMFMGSKLNRMAAAIEAADDNYWIRVLFVPFLMGMIWGAGAGAAGGLVFFGIGAIFGVMFAIPVGILAFTLFMPLHRWLAHGGMIEASHLWPLACGVVMTITALILGL